MMFLHRLTQPGSGGNRTTSGKDFVPSAKESDNIPTLDRRVSCLIPRLSRIFRVTTRVSRHPSFAFWTMTTQSLKDKLVFGDEKGEATLPPDHAFVVITSTLSTPPTFLLQHFLHELLNNNNA